MRGKPRSTMRYALIPVKDLTQAKVRLSPLLSPAERYALATAMLDDVLAAVRQASTVERMALVTTDPHALALAAQWGFEVVDEGLREKAQIPNCPSQSFNSTTVTPPPPCSGGAVANRATSGCCCRNPVSARFN